MATRRTTDLPGRREFAGTEPKKEHTVGKENGTRVERSTNDDPDANIHSQEIKIERHNGGDDKPSPEEQDAE